MNTYEAARRYHSAGLSPIPLDGKRPTVPWKEYQERVADNSELFEWFSDQEGVNIGLITGSISGGLLVLDWDDLKAFNTWAEEHPELVNTKTVETGGGGRHLYYRIHHADGLTTQPFSWRDLHCGEIRSQGGLVVAPPSIHPGSGRSYRWLTGKDVPIKEIDSWRDLELELGRKKEQQQRVADRSERIPIGQRNSTLTSLAGTMRARGMTVDAIKAALRRENFARCDPPLTSHELERTIFKSIETWRAGKPRRIGARVLKAQAEAARKANIRSPDPELRQRVTDIRRGKADSAKGRSQDERREIAGEVLTSWLLRHGSFVKSKTDGELYYFYNPEKRLFDLESNHWLAWLYALTGANPAGRDFAFLQTDCKTVAELGEEREVVRVAAWDDKTQTLRVSGFGGTVHVMDGERITQEDNGEHVLFDDSPWWEPYDPDFDNASGAALRWSTLELPPLDGNQEMQALGLRAWVLATFFVELCPTRPLLVLVGERGSGKTMTLRVLLRLMFGPGAEVSGVPDKRDGFTAAAAANHIIVLDNLDEFTPWLRDKLARLSTGTLDHYRKLYSSNEEGVVRYRTWVALTARTPDTLRRDDLADRILLMPTRHIKETERRPERDFLDRVRAIRNAWWADVLQALNQIVASIRRGELSSTTTLRMGDWESLGRLVARNEGVEDLWNGFVVNLKRQQSAFLLEDSLIVEGIEMWMINRKNHGRTVSARELRKELSEILFGDDRPTKDWPKTTSGFGRRLRAIVSGLQTEYQVETWKERNRWKYRFAPLAEHKTC